MPSLNFGDQYKAAGLAPGPEIIRLRQVPFDQLKENIDHAMIFNLTRLYFGLPLPDGADWFRDAFAETDPSFSMIDNEREAAILAVCLLAAALEDGETLAGLAPIVATAGGNRPPMVYPEFISLATQALLSSSINAYSRNVINVNKITSPAASKAAELANMLASNPDWSKAAQAINLAASESFDATKKLAEQVVGVLMPLVIQVDNLREEVSMLWWYVGGWSRILEQPFAELDIGIATLMAGIDLAHITEDEHEPAAARALLYRLLAASFPTDKATKLSLESALKNFPFAKFEELEIPDKLNSISSLCPVLTALSKANEASGESTWSKSFQKATQLQATIEFTPIELAMQVYRELRLLAQID